VKSFQGRGTFVTKAPDNDRWIQLATDWESLIAPIRNNVPHLLPSGDVPPPRIEESDGTPAADYVFIRSIQKQAGRPYAFARVHVAKHVHAHGPKLFSSRVALAVLSEMEDLEISRAHQTLAIGSADMETARNLGIALNAPTVEAHCVVADAAGVVIYVGEITYPGDCVRLNIELIGGGQG
jgi:GntR family transcriptional regulator